MKTKTLASLLLIGIVFSKSAVGQSLSKEPKFYNWYDDQVKLYNTGLYNGVKYIELYRTINDKHKFFKSTEFLVGSIEYDGQFYDQVPLKYDLDTDEVLLNIGYNYQYPTLILFKSKISRFSIAGSNFIQVESNDKEPDFNGFYEVLLDGNALKLLKKNNKKRFKKIRGTTIYYEFIPENNYVVSYNEEMHNIHNKQDVIRIWPMRKDFINENYNSDLKKGNEDEFWTGFFSKLSDSFNAKN